MLCQIIAMSVMVNSQTRQIPVVEMVGHKEAVTGIVYDSVRGTILSGGYEATIFRWNPSDGTMVGKTLAMGPIDAMAISSDSQTVAVGEETGEIEVFNLTTNLQSHLFRTSRMKRNPITALEFSPDGKYLATSGKDGLIRIWSLEENVLVTKWQASSGEIDGIDFTQDGNYLLSGDSEGKVTLWEKSTKKNLHSFHIEGLIFSVKISPNKKDIAVGGSFGCYLFDMEGKEKQRKLGKADYISRRLCFSPDGSLLVEADADDSIRVHSLADRTFTRVGGLKSFGSACAFACNGTKLLVGTWDGELKMWSTKDFVRH